MDTADADTILNTNLQVSIISPGCTPGVLHDVFFLEQGCNPIADDQDCKINIGPAEIRYNHDGSVEPEHVSGGLDCHGHRCLCDCRLKCLSTVVSDCSPAFGLDGCFFAIVLARLGLLHLRIRLFLHHAFIGSKFEGLVCVAPLAPMIEAWRAGAVHELLLRESVQNAVSNLSPGFQGTDCREGPVGFASALVLDRRDRVPHPPVHRHRALHLPSIRQVRECL